MVIRKKQSVLEVNTENVKIFDYRLPSNDVGFSYQELNGRVPESGEGRNTECDEWYFVVAGTGESVVDGIRESIEPGDLVYIPKNKSSYLIASSLKIITVTKPNWEQEQYQEVN